MKLGKFEVFEIDAGRFKLDGGAMFGVVPKPLWERSDPADDKNRIQLAMRTLLIKSDDFNLLIDCGMGNKWNAKQRSMFELKESPLDCLLKQQANIGVDDITHVLITHLHFDHCGGLTYFDVDSKLDRTFKNAQIIVHEENYKWAEKPNQRERVSYLKENWALYTESSQINLVRSNPLEKKEVLPGIWSIRSDGHTRGQQTVLVDGGKDNKLFFCGDLIPSSSHLKIPWTMGYDINPLMIMEEKKFILEEAVRENWLLYFEHDARGALGSLLLDKDKRGEPIYLLKNDLINL